MIYGFISSELSVKGEFIVHRTGLAGHHEATHVGLYGQGTYDFGRSFVVGRYGRSARHGADPEDLSRLGLGAGWLLLEGCEFRVEYQVNEGGDSDVAVLQLVVGFAPAPASGAGDR